jgi:hypothetical protein
MLNNTRFRGGVKFDGELFGGVINAGLGGPGINYSFFLLEPRATIDQASLNGDVLLTSRERRNVRKGVGAAECFIVYVYGSSFD